MQPIEVAEAVLFMLTRPRNVTIRTLLLCQTVLISNLSPRNSLQLAPWRENE